MKLESTIFTNINLVIDDNNTPVGVQIDGKLAFSLYEQVAVTPDVRGYICPGVRHGGLGMITEIRRDDTDHFFGVRMVGTGEFGYMKEARLTHI